jgi:Tuberculosis necrotizing toxin
LISEPVAGDQPGAPSGRAVLQAWRVAERTALAVLGFDWVGTDRYEYRLDADDWVGGISLPKRSQGAVGRGGVVALDPFVFSLGHVPTERLIHQLKGLDPDPHGFITLPGWPAEDLPADVVRRLGILRIDKPHMAEDAAALTARVIEDWVLPWMRANADLGRLARRLASHNSFGSQARQLERLATVSYQLGDRDAAAAALREYRARCFGTGISAIDGPSERFAMGLHERLHGPASPAGSGSGLRRAELVERLQRAGVPEHLYALVDLHPPPSWLESYYFLAERSERFVVGVHERGHDRIGADFGDEDAACRALRHELVFDELPPRQLTLHHEHWARGQTAATLQAAMPSIRRTTRNPGAPKALVVLGEGPLLDHLGQESGSYLYPDGIPFQQRSLPPSVLVTLDPRYPNNYHRYQVTRPFTVHAGIVVPAFEQPGGGVQLKVESALLAERPMLATVLWLLRNGYLRRVTPA